MGDAFSYVFDTIPWLGPFLAWLFAITVTILLLSIPAYFVLVPLFRRMRAEAGRWTTGLAATHRANRENRRGQWLELVNQFLRDNALKRMHAGAAAMGAGISTAVARQLKRLRKAMAKMARAQGKLASEADSLSTAIGKAAVGSGTASAKLVDAEEMARQTETQGAAWLEFIVGVPFLLAMITVNTVMLSQILRDLGVIPPQYMVIGIPLVYFLALLLSFVDAGAGFWHSSSVARHQGSRGGEEAPIAWGAHVVLLIPLTLSVWEGQNYAGIGPVGQTVNVPFTDIAMRKADLYFLLGLAIVWTLFGVGSLCYRAARQLVHGAAPRRMVKQLERVVKAEGVLAASKSAVAAGPGPAVDPDALNKLKMELDRLAPASAAAGVMESTDLSTSEVIQLSQQAGFWIIAGCAALGLMALTGLESFAILAPDLAAWLAWVLATGQAIVWISAGMLFASGETVVKSETGAVVAAAPWSRVLGVMLVALLAATYIWVMVLAPQLIRLAWTCNFVFGVMLLAVAYRLHPLLGVALIWLRSVGNLLAAVAEFILRLLAHIAHAIAVVLDFLAEVLASPILAFKRSGRGGPEPPSAAAAVAQ